MATPMVKKNKSTFEFFACFRIQQDSVGHYQLGQKNTVYLEMIYLGVQCMYFCANPLQNQCILGLVHYTFLAKLIVSHGVLLHCAMILKILRNNKGHV